MQKWIAETVQILAQIGGAEKNGSDADEFADLVQMNVQYTVQNRLQNAVQASVQNFVQKSVQIHFADVRAESGATPAGRPVYREGAVQISL